MASPNHKDKSHHSSLFSVFQRKKRQTSAPIAPQSPRLHNNENIENQPIDQIKSLRPPTGFAQRLKLHKKSRNGDKEIEEFGPLKTSQSQTLTKPAHKKNKNEGKSTKKGKTMSTDAINEMDPDFLIEALLAIGDEQPTVARSIPKHSVPTQSQRKTEERLHKNCIFEPEIYDKMLSDSLLVCSLLEDHLDDCVKNVRAKSPLMGKKGPVTGSFQDFLITATAPSTPSRSPAIDHRSPVTISSSSMSPYLLSSSPSPSFYRQRFLDNQQESRERTPKKDFVYVQ